jgi:hypothetical protein
VQEYVDGTMASSSFVQAHTSSALMATSLATKLPADSWLRELLPSASPPPSPPPPLRAQADDALPIWVYIMLALALSTSAAVVGSVLWILRGVCLPPHRRSVPWCMLSSAEVVHLWFRADGDAFGTLGLIVYFLTAGRG